MKDFRRIAYGLETRLREDNCNRIEYRVAGPFEDEGQAYKWLYAHQTDDRVISRGLMPFTELVKRVGKEEVDKMMKGAWNYAKRH